MRRSSGELDDLNDSVDVIHVIERHFFRSHREADIRGVLVLYAYHLALTSV